VERRIRIWQMDGNSLSGVYVVLRWKEGIEVK